MNDAVKAEVKEPVRLTYSRLRQMALDIFAFRGAPPYTPAALHVLATDNEKANAANEAEAILISDFVQHWMDSKSDPLVPNKSGSDA